MKAVTQAQKHRSGCIDRHHPARHAVKHGLAELRLGLDDLLADGADGNAKLVRGGLQRAETAHRLQRT